MTDMSGRKIVYVDGQQMIVENEKKTIAQKAKFIRNHIEIEIGDRKFEISIDETEGCKEVLVINKIGYESESSQICILTKCVNEIAIM